MKHGIIKEVTRLESISESADMLYVTLESTEKYYLVGNFTETLALAGLEVEFQIVRDIYKGQTVEMITSITQFCKINTVDVNTTYKLYNDETDSQSSIIFRDIKMGETIKNAIVRVLDVQYGSTPKCTFNDYTIVDKLGHRRRARLFSPDMSFDTSIFKQKYVQCTLTLTKFGFNTEEVKIVTGLVDYEDTEVALAKSAIQGYTGTDDDLTKVMKDMNLLDTLELEVIKLLARELTIVASMHNITSAIDTRTLNRAFIFDKLHHVVKESRYQPRTTNILILNKYRFAGYEDVIVCLDGDEIFTSIKEMAETITRIKVGL